MRLPSFAFFVRSLSLLSLGFATGAVAEIPAFPGAEGFGAYSTGGRGGDVYHVTTLSNSGVGSFNDAIATVPGSGRTIVFDVSGYIHVNKTSLSKSKVTIAGQTAPGDGIGFKDGSFVINGSNVIIRHARYRFGEAGGAGGGDCINIGNGVTRLNLDHLSIEFSTDENISSFEQTPRPDYMTMQWTLDAWGIEGHSCGGLWDIEHVTTIKNLWAHNHTRNPKARAYGLLDWINNVTFDWDIGFIMGDSSTPAAWKANVIGNYFVCPPGNIRQDALEKANLDRNGAPNFTLHLNNNRMDNNGNNALDGSDYGYGIASGSYATSASPIVDGTSGPVTIDAPLLAYKKIVSQAGALRMNATAGIPIRDEVDTILVNNLVTLRRNHISNESGTGASNGGFGTLTSTGAPADTDRDGTPDYWETAVGWNPGSDDHNSTAFATAGGIITGTTFFPANTPTGYTYLEEYLHFLTIPHAIATKSTAAAPASVDIDLRRYTSGFALNAAYALTAVFPVAAGSATLQPDGHTVRFVPAQDYVGRARFDFTVNDGDAWTQTVGILVSAFEQPKNLVWSGTASNVWNGTAINWTAGGVPAAFGFSDNVTFDDTSTVQTITLPSRVSPGSVAVNAAKPYTFSGAGAIAGSGGLLKTGTGTLTLGNTDTNSYAGGTVIAQGTVNLTNVTSPGSGTITLDGGSLLLTGSGGPATYGNLVNVTAPSTVTVLGTGNTNQSLGGTLTGSEVVTFDLRAGSTFSAKGTMSAFNGAILLSGAGSFRWQGSTGSGLADWDLGVGTNIMYSRDGGSVSLGSLSGGPGTILKGAGSSNTATTYTIGANGRSTTFQGMILSGSFSGATVSTAVTKTGTGSLTLTGPSFYTGATTVNAGALIVDGTLGNTAVTINSGAALAGRGQIGGLTTIKTGGLLRLGGNGTADTLKFAGGLTLTGTGAGLTVPLDLSENPGSGNDLISLPGGVLTLTGTITIQPTLLGELLSSGTYVLFSSTNAIVGGTANLKWGGAPSSRQSFVFETTPQPGKVLLIVTGNAVTLNWSGTNGTTWNNAAVNWQNGAVADNFFDGDAVIFDDALVTGTATLTGTVKPRRATFSNIAKPVTLGGVGAIAGSGSLVKNGAGPLTIANSGSNSFTGGSVLSAGVLSLVNTTAPLGSGVIRQSGGRLQLPNSSIFLDNSMVFSGTSVIAAPFSGNTAIANSTASSMTSAGNALLQLEDMAGVFSISGDMSGFSGAIELGDSHGMLRLNGGNGAANHGSAGALFNLGTGSATLANRNGDITIDLGALASGAGATLQGRQSGSGATATTYVIGALNTDTVFGGSIASGGDLNGVNIIKVGTGVWTLSGSSNFTGALSVQEGRVSISGWLACTDLVDARAGATLHLNGGVLQAEGVTIEPGAFLTGAGRIDTSLDNKGTVLAATGGTLTITGNVTNNGTMRFTNGTRLNATGLFTNNGILDLITGSPGSTVNYDPSGTGVVIDTASVEVVALIKTSTSVQMTFETFAGHTYQLQSSPTITPPTWTNVGSPQSGGGQLPFSDAISPGDRQKFYRIVVSP